MFSALSCLPAGPSLSPHSCPSRNAGGESPAVRRGPSHAPNPTLTLTPQEAFSRLSAASATSPNWGFSFGVGGGCSTNMEGGRTTWGGQGLGGWVGKGGQGRDIPSGLRWGKDTWPVHLGRARSGGGGALSLRSPRPPVGGALVMHYSSPSSPPARPRCGRLPRFPRAGSGLHRAAGARSLHNIVAAPRVTAQGRRGCAALAAGGGCCGWEGFRVRAMLGHTAQRGLRRERGCGSAKGQSL